MFFFFAEAGKVMHDCEAELVCRWTLDDKVPYFNAGVYLENKRKIGKVDEILGKVSEVFFTVKMDPGVLSKSFQPNDLLYVGTDKLLPLARFTNPGARVEVAEEDAEAEAVVEDEVEEAVALVEDEAEDEVASEEGHLAVVGEVAEVSPLAEEGEEADFRQTAR
jgi:rRNA processing protein Gar1